MIRVGESALLLRCASTADVLAALRALEAAPRPGLRDLVPGAETLLAIFRGEPGPEDEAWLARGEAAVKLGLAPGLASRLEELVQPALQPARRREIPVRYDGEDLEAVARHARLGVADVVGLHASVTYQVAFLGFQPGFAYLAGLPATLRVPRRATPRPRVPAGSVAIGGEWTGVYPAESPGGWNLVGTTGVSLFDADADPPAVLLAGDEVRFVPL